MKLSHFTSLLFLSLALNHSLVAQVIPTNYSSGKGLTSIGWEQSVHPLHTALGFLGTGYSPAFIMQQVHDGGLLFEHKEGKFIMISSLIDADDYADVEEQLDCFDDKNVRIFSEAEVTELGKDTGCITSLNASISGKPVQVKAICIKISNDKVLRLLILDTSTQPSTALSDVSSELASFFLNNSTLIAEGN